jgi:dephospho-CoA kinase
MIFLVGPHGSGKTELGKKIVKDGQSFLDLGPIIRSCYSRSTEFKDIREWVEAGERVLGSNFTDHILSNEVLQYVYKHNIDLTKLVISGNRQLSGILYLVNFFSEFKEEKVEYSITYIDAPEETLLERYNLREGKGFNIEEFRRKFAVENETLNEIRWVADSVINNIGTVDEMFDSFRQRSSLNTESNKHLRMLR